jgi:hypothetical protein
VWKEAVVVIFMKGLRKTMKNLIQDNWSADWDLNLELSEYEVGMLATQVHCLFR